MRAITALVCAVLACMTPAAGAPATEPPWLEGVPTATPSRRAAEAPVDRRPNGAARSVVLDAQAATSARERFQPVYVESIVVEGRDPDARPRKFISLENRFAHVLLAPPAARAVGLRGLDTTPCMSMSSTWNSIGNSYAPLAGCP